MSLYRRRRNANEFFWALRDLSFDIERGEAVGIIGRNGAGKSTFLKVLSRITEPSTGFFELFGRVSSLLEVGTGFHNELTGRENIYLNGTILGMKRNEIRSKFDEIVSFSDVETFLDTPVKHYSSGMKVRLAFSVAAHLEPEILIVDEVLAVGDAEFQRKCLGKMDKVSKDDGRTVLFVSHNMGAVSKLCNRGIVLNNGEVVFNGDTEDAITNYNSLVGDLAFYEDKRIDSQKDFHITEVSLYNSSKQKANAFAHDEEISIHIEFFALSRKRGFNICFAVYNDFQQVIFTSDVPLEGYKVASKKNWAEACIPASTLTSGNYSLMVAIHDPAKGGGAVSYLEFICPFQVFDNGSHFLKYEGRWEVGNVFVNCSWKFGNS